MSILTDLATAAGGLLCVAGGAGLIYLFGRDPKADDHDLTDYLPRARTVDEPTPVAEPTADAEAALAPVVLDVVFLGPCDPVPARRNWPLVDRKPLPPREPLRRDVLPPAPPGMDAGSPLWRQLVIEQVVPTLPDAAVRGIADEWLREIAAEQHARAGIRPASEHWAQVDGSCWDDCPACARDLTGAFAVVRAA